MHENICTNDKSKKPRNSSFRKKILKCKMCNKAFTEAGNLRVYERINTGEKPFQCKKCSREFTKVHSNNISESVPISCLSRKIPNTKLTNEIFHLPFQI